MDRIIMLCDGSRMVVKDRTPDCYLKAAERIIRKKTLDADLYLFNNRPDNDEIIRKVGEILN